jgi:hypothetical protein
MGSPVTKWKAVDGAEFDTQKDMLLHELGLNEAAEIAVFLDTQYAGSRRKSEYKRVLAQFAEYMRDARYIQENPAYVVTAGSLENVNVELPPAPVVEWVPEGGYMLQEGGVVDDSAEIEKSFRRAQKL